MTTVYDSVSSARTPRVPAAIHHQLRCVAGVGHPDYHDGTPNGRARSERLHRTADASGTRGGPAHRKAVRGVAGDGGPAIQTAARGGVSELLVRADRLVESRHDRLEPDGRVPVTLLP